MILETLRDIAIALSLCILIPLTLMYGLKVFSPAPQFKGSEQLHQLESESRDLSKQRDQLVYDRQVILDKKLDEYKQQLNNEKIDELDKKIKEKEDAIDEIRSPLQKQYQDEGIQHARLNLIISGVIGILLLLCGFFFPVNAISAGLVFGGTGCLVMSYLELRYMINEKIQFFIMLAAICVVIALAYWFFMRSKKSV